MAIAVDARKPRWLLRPLPKGDTVQKLEGLIAEHGLHTVCQEARCPNRGECWAEGEATLMIGGDVCTRGCRFCHVASGKLLALDPAEPEKVAFTVKTMDLSYVVITSVDRDDLDDQGAWHWHRTIAAVKRACPDTVQDVLLPDFQGREDLIKIVVDAGPHVLAHNIETVRRLHPTVRDHRATYEQSLGVHRAFKRLAPGTPTKSGIMVGLGETRDEVYDTLVDLRAAGVDFVTIGQYLRPSDWHLAVERYVTPEEFADMERDAREVGFKHVAAGPFVRSSYRAWETEAIVRAAHGMAPKAKGAPGGARD